MAKKKTIRTIPQERTPMPEQDPSVRARNFKEVACGYTLENALRDRQVDSTTGLALRSDNGLVFGAKAFVRVARRYGLHQEYITPYSPEQNG